MAKKRWGTRDLDEPRPHTPHPMTSEDPNPPDRKGESEYRHCGTPAEAAAIANRMLLDKANRVAPAMKRSRTAVPRYDKNNNGRGD